MKKAKDGIPQGAFADMENDGPVYGGPPIYSLYNRPPKVVQDVGSEPGADQSFKEECDIRVIIARAKKTGMLIDPVQLARATRMPIGEDVSGVPETFFDAQLFVKEAEEAFYKLPSAVRVKFGHDVGAMMQFLSDEKNRDEAVRLGLLPKPEAPAAPPAPAPPAPGGDPGKGA